jgi:hypothetical protein
MKTHILRLSDDLTYFCRVIEHDDHIKFFLSGGNGVLCRPATAWLYEVLEPYKGTTVELTLLGQP